MEDLLIRAFDWEKDYGRVLEFQEDLYKSNYPNFIASYGFYKQIEKKLLEASKSDKCCLKVAEKNKWVVAFLWAEFEEDKTYKNRIGVINQLYIIPKWRKEGLGEILLNEGDNFFKSNNVRKIRINVSASNVSAFKLYKKNGFEPLTISMEKEYSF